MNRAGIERSLLWCAIVVLGIALAWFAGPASRSEANGSPEAVPGDAPDCVACDAPDCVACKEELAPRFDAIDEAIGDLAKSVDGLATFEQRIVDDVAARVAVPVTPACPPSEVEDCDEPSSIRVKSKFTFFYENARLNEDREVVLDSVGIRLAPRHHRRLELLTKAFRPCNRDDAPVEFGVSGYSSTAEFRAQPEGEPLDDSDALNLETANLRAKIVGDYLLSEGFKVETRQWLSEGDLQRPYLDDAQPGMDQQALNRTVSIELRSAGACDLAR